MQIQNEYDRSFGRYSPAQMRKSDAHEPVRQLQSMQSERQNEEPEEMGLLEQFKQQMMKAWQPVPTLTKTIIMFFILSGIFLGIGIPMIILSQNLNESSLRYDNLGAANCTGTVCNVTFEVTSYLQAPVFVYYEIHNFYQNHRLYASSYSYDQLIGKQISASTAQSNCAPIVYNRDLYKKVSAFNTSQTLNPDDVANPCGMIAYTYFNDTFNLYNKDNTEIQILGTGIAWPTDVQKYKVSDPNKLWVNITDERFMNWMRIAAMSDFRKLWGRIEQDVQPDNYTLVINNSSFLVNVVYDLSKINGQKFFVLSTSNFFGSKSNFLAISYISVGSVCCLMGFLFLMRKLSKKTKIL